MLKSGCADFLYLGDDVMPFDDAHAIFFVGIWAVGLMLFVSCSGIENSPAWVNMIGPHNFNQVCYGEDIVL